MQSRREISEARHGSHTLRVFRGTVVGVDGDDVFVEFGPRMQGVISSRRFSETPREGDEHDFTLRGQEEGLWALSLTCDESLHSWEEMEIGSRVQARAERVRPGGLEMSIGPLHAFMPRSQTGLDGGLRPQDLIGRSFVCEVTEVDPERQRVFLSRKKVLKNRHESERARQLGELRPGQVVDGRVTRVESYGAFVRFGHGLTGLVHASDLAHRRVEDARTFIQRGSPLRAVVLKIGQGGRRIALGVKQLDMGPWQHLEKLYFEGQLVEGRVSRTAEYGASIALASGVEGFVPRSECGLGERQGVRTSLARGQHVAARIVELDVERERLILSLLHPEGARIDLAELEGVTELPHVRDAEDPNDFGTSLGDLLRRAVQ